MTSRVRPNNCNYYSVGALACIILLLSGSIQFYFYMTNLSFANRAYGQLGNVDDERSEGSSDSNGDETSPKSTQDTKSQDSLPPQQAQPTTTTPTTPTENAKSEDNSSDQSTGPVRFTFVDSFWTDYTSLGGVI